MAQQMQVKANWPLQRASLRALASAEGRGLLNRSRHREPLQWMRWQILSSSKRKIGGCAKISQISCVRKTLICASVSGSINYREVCTARSLYAYPEIPFLREIPS